jgi:DNA repair exonuclease SbcCD ATPase subunit
MIQFTRVRYQNFLATGNAPITIELDKHATTLVTGRNGAGKSTMSEAVCFALFAKPLRNVNKPKLVNSINQKDCVVELWFSNTQGNYYIKRGIKPAIFEIYRNDILEPIPANLDDYQTSLESILKLNYKSFKQVVILGSASYTPFMRLAAAGRREIIEDILDIQVFSSMNALAKEDLTDAKLALEANTLARKAITDQLALAISFQSHLAQQNTDALTVVNDAITQTDAQMTDFTTERLALVPQVAIYDAAIKRQTTALNHQHNYERILEQLRTKACHLHKDHTFYAEHTTCPECEQVITEEFKQTRFATLAQKEADAAKAIAQCEGLIATYRTAADTATHDARAVSTAGVRIAKIDTLLPVYRRRLSELTAEQWKLQQPVTAPNVDVPALTAQLATLDAEQKALASRRVILDAATMLLKDNGIKTRVIKHYLPIINKTVNHYLTAMDFPILFELGESFDETIKSRYRDEFTYELFSEGEKKRIDLALLLTWREVAKLKNSASTNLLILDEVVFDSSLDAMGVEECLKILESLAHDTNVWVISHRTDQLLDRFTQTIMFEKHKGYSRIH